MGRKWLKRLGLGAGLLVLGTAATIAVVTYTGTNIFPNEGKKHALLRLEDVGPGGDYATPEGLGQLRAVLEYLEAGHVPFQVALIPRRISLEADGTWREKGIDDPSPDETVRAFIRLMQTAERNGGVLGIHGYTHQYGDAARPDGGQNSGTGAEFKVKGAPETYEASYAADRITRGLAAFEKAGLQPGFWESPHYRDTRKQEGVFRSYVGILYEPDLFSLRSFKDMNTYDTGNSYGSRTLGSVYVPAPLRYVSGTESVDGMLKKAGDWDGLASLYLHPFKEFESLEPVLGPDGQPSVRDGLPEYRYKDGGPSSHLHRLVEGLGAEGYRFLSLHDVVPFSPAHRVTLPAGTKAADVGAGDVRGVGHADIVVREAHRITVIPGTYRWPRNRPQEAAEVWLQESFPVDARVWLQDGNGDGKEDLIAYNRETGEVRIGWSDGRRFQAPVSIGTLPAGLQDPVPFRFEDGYSGWVAVSGTRVLAVRLTDGGLTVADGGMSVPENSHLLAGHFYTKGKSAADDGLLLRPPGGRTVSVLRVGADGSLQDAGPVQGLTLKESDQLLAGDYDGDGRDDAVTYSAGRGVWRVFEASGDDGLQVRPIDNDYGPWAEGGSRIGLSADFDGNGDTDIASYDEKEHVLDLSLSFRASR